MSFCHLTSNKVLKKVKILMKFIFLNFLSISASTCFYSYEWFELKKKTNRIQEEKALENETPCAIHPDHTCIAGLYLEANYLVLYCQVKLRV